MEGAWLTNIKSLAHKAFDIKTPEFVSGIHLSIICTLPILVGIFLGQLQIGVMAFVGSLYVVLADVGGAYRQRAWAMSLAIIMNALAAFIATLVGDNPFLAIPLMFLWAFGFSMMGVFGNFGSKVSFAIIGIFVIILGQPASVQIALERFGAFIVGGIWAMVLSLLLWPFRPYQPARKAVAGYYRALRVFVTKTCDPAIGNVGIGARWIEAAKRERASVMAAHDKAHTVVLTTRSSREGASRQIQQLLMLSLNADRLLEEVIALTQGIEHASHHAHFPYIRKVLTQAVQQISVVFEQLAITIEDGRKTIDVNDINQSLSTIITCEEELREFLPQLADDYAALVNLQSIIRVLEHTVETLRTAGDATYQLNSNKRENWKIRLPHTLDVNDIREAFHLLRDNLSADSIVFRYALRLAATTAAAVAIASILHISYGYWISLTVLFILKPDFGATRQRAIQRIMGTVTGGLIAALLAFSIHNYILLMAIMILVGFMCFAHLSGNYGIFVIFLTMYVVVLFDLGNPGSWEVALIRIMNTLIGGAMAFSAGYLFWPLWERERLPNQLARTIAANRDFFVHVLSAYVEPQEDAESIHRASKLAHVQNANAAAAFQRLLREPKDKQGDVERFFALAVYNQRFCDSITTLAAYIPATHNRQNLPSLRQFIQQTDQVLRTIETDIREGKNMTAINPSLEESWQSVQSSLQTLISARVAHLTTPRVDIETRDPIIDYALIGTQLGKLTRDVSGMAQIS